MTNKEKFFSYLNEKKEDTKEIWHYKNNIYFTGNIYLITLKLIKFNRDNNCKPFNIEDDKEINDMYLVEGMDNDEIIFEILIKYFIKYNLQKVSEILYPIII
jgi:hypothetical protein